MPSRLYRDYIKVDKNFIPVFSKDSDRVYPDKWQSFYPHQDFKDILTQVIETLEMSNESKNRSLWMSGAYGTGKTYASFTIKHILEDAPETVETWFAANNMKSLYTKLIGVRSQGPLLVVHRSSSANITSQDLLFSLMMESVRDALRAAGKSYLGAGSLRERVISVLKDPDSSFSFTAAFKKHHAEFDGYASAQGVIRDLEELDPEDTLELLQTVIEVGEKEHYMWSTTPEAMVDWLEDVRIKNGLHAIVFIWDEFTEYFKNNPNRTGGLQEIAQASSRIHFYFFLITHSDINQLIKDSSARQIIEARFKQSRISMGDKTAFKLMGQALQRDPDLLDEWRIVETQLWNTVEKTAVKHMLTIESEVVAEDFRRLLPMQPYAAYLLRVIAGDISSNTRTMFKFLTEAYDPDGTEPMNFSGFIDRHAKDDGQCNLLTADVLWDYFFRADNVDLDANYLTAINNYNSFISACTSDEQRSVLKVTLLLGALQAANGIGVGKRTLLAPTLQNLKACFAGTAIAVKVEGILEELSKAGVLGPLGNGENTLYIVNTATVDRDRMKKMIDQARTTIPFEKLIQEPSLKVVDSFKPRGFMEPRCRIFPVCASNWRTAIANPVEPNVLRVVYLFAVDEGQQAKTGRIIQDIYAQSGENCIVVDFTGSPLTESAYNAFIEQKGRSLYFTSLPNSGKYAQLANSNALQTIKEWIDKLKVTQLTVYTAPEKRYNVLSTALGKKLEEIDQSIFEAGLEVISKNDKLYSTGGFSATTVLQGMGKAQISGNVSFLNVHLAAPLTQEGIWASPNYMDQYALHPVSMMKKAVEEVIQAGFNSGDNRVAITEIWARMTRPPFGMMACIGAVFMMGFLLKEYADTTYYKSDINKKTVALTSQDLADLIFSAVKGLPKAKGQFIVRQTQDQLDFCRKTGIAFHLPQSQCSLMDDVSMSINQYLGNQKLPLWALLSYIECELPDGAQKDTLSELTMLFCEYVNPRSAVGVKREKGEIAADISRIYAANPGIEAEFGRIIDSECLRTGMIRYILQYKPMLVRLLEELSLSEKDCLIRLQGRLSHDSAYLWQKEDTNRQIDSLYTDLRLVNSINRVLNTHQQSFADARLELKDKLNKIKLPTDLFVAAYPQLRAILKKFSTILGSNAAPTQDDASAIADVIDTDANAFMSAFGNQYDAFEKAIRTQIDSDATEQEINALYTQVETAMLFKKIDDFRLSMKEKLATIRRNEKTTAMFDAWRKASGCATPEEWSAEHGIPILCMFTDDLSGFQRVFDALNGRTKLASVADVDRAIELLKNGKLDVLKDEQRCKAAFLSYFAPNYRSLITDIGGLQDVLRNSFGSNVYGWFTRKASSVCTEVVDGYCHSLYRTQFRLDAKRKLHSISPEKALAYLEKLIDNDPGLGIRFLNDE